MSVVAGHAEGFYRPFFFINAKAAVLCFFVISGFYMALVLREKYDSRIDFLLNRGLRVYTPYLAITLLFGAYLYATGRFKLDWTTAILNITVLGQDAVRMLNWHPIPATQEPLGIDTFVIPQAWTLAVELQFYLIAAILFPLKSGIWILLGLGIGSRAGMAYLGYAQPPYEIMLVPNVLVLFAMGGAAYLAYRHVASNLPIKINLIIAGAILALLAPYLAHFDGFVGTRNLIGGILHGWLPYPESELFVWSILPLYGLTAALIPFLFSVTKNFKLDRFVGELSYPVYLCHIVVIDTAQRAQMAPYIQRWAVPMLILALAAAIHYTVERPIDSLKHRWTSAKQQRPEKS